MPLDQRFKEPVAAVRNAFEKKLPLPLGISDYRKASTDYYYVDKTLLIQDFIDERPQVSLLTRPRRFGKTDIFNPWSVIGYFNNECIPQAFWQSTGSNDIIREILDQATPETVERLNQFLMQTIRFHDAANETFYHGLVLGLCAMLDRIPVL